MEEICSI